MGMLTRDIYRASKSPAVRALMDLPLDALDAREVKARELSAAGEIIDRQIMIWGWDAVKVMATRLSYGLPWVQAAYQTPLATDTDMSKPWPGSIKSSIDSADYPSLDVPPTPPAAVDEVGTDAGGGIFNANQTAVADGHGGWKHKNGDSITHAGQTLRFFLGSNIMGDDPLWLTEAKYASVIATGAI